MRGFKVVRVVKVIKVLKVISSPQTHLKMNRIRHNLLISLALLACILALPLKASAQVEVEASLDSVAMFIGQQTDLKLHVAAPKDAKVVLPVIGVGKYLTPGVEIVEEQQPDTATKDGRLELTKKFTITSFDENVYVLPELKVKVNGKDYLTKKIALKIVTLDVDTVHPENFFPPKSVQDNPFLWSEWMVEIWSAVAIIVLSLLLYWLWRRLKENKPIISLKRLVKRVPAHQRALEAIEELKADRMLQTENQKEYYTRLTDTLRKYIQERFGFSAMEMTSSEIITRLQETADEKTIRELHELFFTADLVKFAKYSTLLGENDMNLVNAVAFIDKTKTEQQTTMEEVVPTLSEKDKETNMRHKVISIVMICISVAIAAILVYALYWLWQITM